MRSFIAQRPVDRRVMFHRAHTLQRSERPTPFGAGLKLAEEKHEQKDGEMYQLLVAQRQLDCQFQHGISPVYAGSAANWFRVGYLLHAVAWRGSRLTANGLEHRLWLLDGCSAMRSIAIRPPVKVGPGANRVAKSESFQLPHLKPCSCTAAWVTSPSSLPRTRLYGVTPMKHNVKCAS